MFSYKQFAFFNTVMISILYLFVTSALISRQQVPFESIDSIAQANNVTLGKAPVIGVITQLLRDYKRFTNEKKLHLPSSYVKWIETAGGRVLPIMLSQNDSYYETMFNLTNGLLFPGGDNMLRPEVKTPMLEAAKKLYKLALESNDRGDFYPIWGTCLGMQLLSVLSSGKNTLFSCKSHDYMLPVEMKERGKIFAKDALKESDSSIMQGVDYPKMVYDTMQTHNLTYNYHKKCLIEDSQYHSSGLNRFYNVIGYSYDVENKKFIAIFEAKKYPFFGVQFHPEKPPFEFTHDSRVKSVDHSKMAIDVSRYFADYFINLAKRNTRTFDAEKIDSKLIYNFSPTYTGIKNDMYLQRYLFPFTSCVENSDIEFYNDDE